jgi:hypothetical protein
MVLSIIIECVRFQCGVTKTSSRESFLYIWRDSTVSYCNDFCDRSLTDVLIIMISWLYYIHVIIVCMHVAASRVVCIQPD